MRIRKFFKRAYWRLMVGWLALVATPGVHATQGLHYGIRTDTFQPIHALGSWLWYSQAHVQIPSFEKHPPLWFASVGTGVRGLLTPYFALGIYASGGQLQNHSGKSYIINPGLEFCFPWVKIGIQGYHMNHQIPSSLLKTQSELTKHAIDAKVSVTVLSFVRPFFGGYYLSRSSDSNASQGTGSLHANWGVEWLVTSQCSFEVQHEIGQGSFWVRLKLHSSKVHQPLRKKRVIHYLKEPVDQYALPMMSLSFDTKCQDVEAVQQSKAATTSEAVQTKRSVHKGEDPHSALLQAMFKDVQPGVGVDNKSSNSLNIHYKPYAPNTEKSKRVPPRTAPSIVRAKTYVELDGANRASSAAVRPSGAAVVQRARTVEGKHPSFVAAHRANHPNDSSSDVAAGQRPGVVIGASVPGADPNKFIAPPDLKVMQRIPQQPKNCSQSSEPSAPKSGRARLFRKKPPSPQGPFTNEKEDRLDILHPEPSTLSSSQSSQNLASSHEQPQISTDAQPTQIRNSVLSPTVEGIGSAGTKRSYSSR